MEFHPLVRQEWDEDHHLSRRSVIWIEDNAEPGDPHPLSSAIAALRCAPVDEGNSPSEPGSCVDRDALER